MDGEIPVVKGDVVGHAFHGNQYVTAQGHLDEAEKAGQKAAYHEREAARLEAMGDNTQAVIHAFRGVVLRQKERRHRSLASLPVAKGDVPGHPFHGNQWTGGIVNGDYTSPPLATEKDALSVVEGDTNLEPYELKRNVVTKLADRLLEAPHIARAVSVVALHKVFDMGDFGEMTAPGWRNSRLAFSPTTTWTLSLDPDGNPVGLDNPTRDGESGLSRTITVSDDEGGNIGGVIRGSEPETKVSVPGDDPRVVEVLTRISTDLYVDAWAQNSTDNDISRATQQAVATAFQMDDVRQVGDAKTSLVEAVTPLVKAQYAITQEYLADNGINEITVYRGMKINPSKSPDDAAIEASVVESGTADVRSNPLSSWSVDRSTAEDFADVPFGPGVSVKSLVVSGSVPAEKVFSLPTTGIGCRDETEVVLMGGTDKWNATLINADITKGDLPGHAFRGNQYSQGQSEPRQVDPNRYQTDPNRNRASDDDDAERQEHIDEMNESLRQISTEQERGNRLRADRHKLSAAWHFLRLVRNDDEVKKGDVPGHAFHGNQWTTVSDAQAKELAKLYVGTFRYRPNGSALHTSIHERTPEQIQRKYAFQNELHARITGATANTSWGNRQFSPSDLERAVKDVDDFMRAVTERATPSATELVRGVALTKGTQFAVGEQVEMPLASWDNGDRRAALGWTRTARDDKGVFVFHLPQGTLGTTLEQMNYGQQRPQTLTGGNFTVERVETDKKGITDVYLSQRHFIAKGDLPGHPFRGNQYVQGWQMGDPTDEEVLWSANEFMSNTIGGTYELNHVGAENDPTLNALRNYFNPWGEGEQAQSHWYDSNLDNNAVNNALWSGEASPELRETIDLLRNAIADSTTSAPMTVYRGIVEQDYNDLQAGETIGAKGFTSTSLLQGVAEGFGDGTLMEIHLPKGSNAIGLLATPDEWGEVSGEAEVLLHDNASFRVDGARVENGKTIYTVTYQGYDKNHL